MVPFEGYDSALAILGIVVGLLACFFGYRLFKVTLALVGFLLGAALVGSIAAFIIGDMGTVVLVVAVIAGVISAITLLWAYFVGMFVVGALAGGLIGSAVSVYVPGEWIGIAVIVGLALIGGVLALKIQRVVLSLSTATIGAAGVVVGVALFLLGGETLLAMTEGRGTGALTDWRGWAIIGSWVLVTAIGCSTQIGTNEDRDDD